MNEQLREMSMGSRRAEQLFLGLMSLRLASSHTLMSDAVLLLHSNDASEAPSFCFSCLFSLSISLASLPES